ncbi:MAG TPA: PqqD family protein, partial [Ktedonobacteraceae bacterium]|nr:PqqD family protein [Ktedonobacteraceae bacterium]
MSSLAKTAMVQKPVLQHFCIQDGLIYVQTSPQRYVVKDVKTGRYFRLSNTIVRIMQCLDGTKSLATIGYELNIEARRVRYVVQQLAELRLLHPESPALERPERKK